MEKYPVATAYKRDPVSKNYNEIVFRPHPSQSSELNDLQEIINHRLQSYIETMYKDGDIISGGYSNLEGNTVYFFDTTVYIKGQILNIPSGEVTIQGFDTESVGILYSEEYITANEDIELLDPAVTTSNYKKRGADRVKYSISWSREPRELGEYDWFYPICDIEAGSLSSVYRLPVDSTSLNNQIAEYDSSTRGSYIVSGVELYYISSVTNNGIITNYIIGISNGKIRLSGREISIPYNTSVSIRASNDVKQIKDEPIIYTNLSEYISRHSPIISIERVIGQQIVEEDITHAYWGSTDRVLNTPLVRVLSVNMLDKEFVEGIDYRIDGDGIQWISDNQPSQGSLYHISYTYTTNITSKVSFRKNEFIVQENPGIPDGTPIYIDYSIHMSRVDTISITPDGAIVVTEGKSSELYPKAGSISQGNFYLGTVKVDANGEEPFLESTDLRTVKVSQQRYNISKLEECEYNIARLGLLMSISAKQPSSILKSTFADALKDDRFLDNAISYCAISDGYLGMKTNWSHMTPYKSSFSLPYTEEIVVSQPNTTKSRIINEFKVFSGNTIPFSINPPVHYFVTDLINTGSSFGEDVYNVPIHDIHLLASGFSGNEDVRIRILDSEYLVQANNGKLDTTIESPVMKSGSALVTIEGVTSKIKATASYVTQPIPQRQSVVTSPPPSIENYNTYYTSATSSILPDPISTINVPNTDPLAQTFQLTEDRDITSVDLFFATKPTTNTYVMITKTSNGLPDPSETLGVCMLSPSQIKTNGTATTFKFDKPLPVTSENVYSIVVGCNDTTAKLQVSELYKQDTITKKTISSDVYEFGSLYQASKLKKWILIPNEDLRMNIKAAKYSSLSLTKEISGISVTDIQGIMILPDRIVPENSSVSVDLSLAGSVSPVNSEIGTPLNLSSYTGTIDLFYQISSQSNKLSPVVYSCQIGIEKLVNPSVYISRSFQTGNGKKLSVYLTSIIPTSCSVNVFYYDSNRGSVTDNSSWIQLSPSGSGNPVGNNWFERTYIESEFPDNVEYTRIKIVLSTEDTLYRPYCVDLRATFSGDR